MLTDILDECTRRGIELKAEGDRLRYRPVEAADDNLLNRLRRHKAALLAVLWADEQASEAGLVVLVPGKLYHAQPGRLAGGVVEAVEGGGEAYAVTWRPEQQGDDSRLKMAQDRTLYKGPDLGKALRAATRWAEEVARGAKG